MCRYVPEMGYYLVITDTEATERFFFTGLHDSLPPNMQKKLVIKVVETKTQNMIQKCMELTAFTPQSIRGIQHQPESFQISYPCLLAESYTGRMLS